MRQPPIRSEKVRIERKQFFLDLRENPKGRFLQITEDVKGRRDAIMIPETGLVEFRDALSRIIEALPELDDVPEGEPEVANEVCVSDSLEIDIEESL